MDLAALWNREKARVAAELNAASVGPANGERRPSVSVARDDIETRGLTRAKGPAVAASPTVKPSAATKKKSTALTSTTTSYMRDRDRVFRLLLESSVTPSPTKTSPHYCGNNEFAMEYADRAVRQFIPQPTQPQFLLDSPAQTSSSSPGFTSSTRAQINRNPSIRVNSIVQTPSAPVPVAQSAVQTTVAFPAMTKTAQILRKNGRKRAGTEYSSQALKPYVGDMFSTRGEYIDGMLYMSRMKRSYQAMVSSGDQRGKKLDFSFSSPQWGARADGRA
ncbi:Serine/threonine-protein phosphatase [Phytophthora cinnamomi]|uniref:Serine/threonine-protein phosphatase n=1 Tax=Phytophthora cinnamomi TaxID=4785 RepID=UPI003559945B|nr:Serine/threonine-protein phosphatase [Phytophthora cinnamomi]